jgi:hypothetical protein
MNCINIKPDRTEEKDLLICDVSDEALEKAADTQNEKAVNITWYYCPTGLTICRY